MSDLYQRNGYSSTRTITVSDSVVQNPSAALAVMCTVAGNVSVTLVSGTVTVPVAVGLTILPFLVTILKTTGTTATATYALLN